MANPESTPPIIVIEMLVRAGGRERTETEFAELLATAHLKLNRVIESPTAIRLLEALKA